MFDDGKDLVIFNTPQDLREKINFYLKNESARSKIAKNGFDKVQKYDRDAWAKGIINVFNNTRLERSIR